MGVLASVLVGYIPAPLPWFVSKSCHVSRARACTLLGKMAAATPSPLKRSRRAEANEAPPVPDVGQAWGADFVAGAAAELRDDQLVPLCPGMQPALKPSCSNMTRLHRSKVPPVPSGPGKGSKPNYRGLPRKYALGVPMIRLHAKGLQLYLVTLVSIAMCIPRGKVISTFKLTWLTKTGDSYSINPGEDAATFKNGTWRAGSTLVRPELAKAIEKYVNLG